MEKIIELLPINNVTNISAVTGGDVNESYKLEADGGSYFLKVHRIKMHRFLLVKEQVLNYLRKMEFLRQELLQVVMLMGLPIC